MVTFAERQKFKVGRKFRHYFVGTSYEITDLDENDRIIYAKTSGVIDLISVDTFDVYYTFVDDELSVGYQQDMYGYWDMAKPKCECGSDSYYGVDMGPHSDYCPKHKREEKNK